jgi:hypothetical protein
LWDNKQKTYSFSLPQSASLTAPSSEGALVWRSAKQQFIDFPKTKNALLQNCNRAFEFLS